MKTPVTSPFPAATGRDHVQSRRGLSPLLRGPSWFAKFALLIVVTLGAGLGAARAQLISENFTTSAANFTVVSGGTWSVTGGKYVLTAPVNGAAGTGNANISIHNTAIPGDFTLTVDGSTTATSALWNDFSVIFNYQNSTNYYYLSLNESNDGGTNGLFKFAGGVQTELADITTLITAGTTYSVKIVKTGSTLQAYRNGTLVATATDSTFTGGKVGFGTLNDGASYDNLVVTVPQAAAPTFSPAAGTYTAAQAVTISSTTSGASIRYTTNGTAPTSTTGTVYSTPVTINSSVTLKAIAYKTGLADSTVTSGVYTINLSDTQAPTAPTGLTGVAVSSSQINLGWAASTDNVGVTNYLVYRGATQVGTPTGTTFSDTGLTASTSYTYTVKAKDAANNLSPASNAVTVSTLSNSGTPVRVASYGPNGTHWPSLVPTPFMYDGTVPNIVNVACTWPAIAAAITAVTPTQAAAGVLIKVAPGNLVGNGSGSGNTPVLQALGSTTWSKRVTVCPRDGYGTVTFSGGVRILQVHGVCFAGFKGDDWKLQGCIRGALAWTKLTGFFAGYGAASQTTTQVEFVEVVQPDSFVINNDSSDFYSAGGDITGWRFEGCYSAPRYFQDPPPDPKPHTDTLQFSAAGGGTYTSMTFLDCAYYSSNNCSIQTGGLDGATFNHSYVVSGPVSRSRYPWLAGGSTEATTNAFNGSGGNFVAIDSIFIGGMAINTSTYARPWTSATNTRTDQTYGASNQPLSGAWIVDGTLSATNPTMPPYPTDSYLNSIWQ